VRDPKEIEEMFGRPILGAIPQTRGLELPEAGPAVLDPPAAEAFRMLRANLRYFNIDRDVQSVLVTSAAPADGKTTVAWNLATTAAGAGESVLLVEADLRHPRLASRLGLLGSPGLSTVLAGQAELDEVVQEMPVGDRAGGGGVRTLEVVLAGPLPPNPSDLLESDRMRQVLAAAERRYDLVVVDTPPTSIVSDAIPIIEQVGGVIVVGRLAKTTREGAMHLRNQLRNLDAQVLGVVVNGIGSEPGGYDGYGYAYGYGYGPTDQPLTDSRHPQGGVPAENGGPPRNRPQETRSSG
jgi:capsular exopolysaccharide synthesis family protein